MEIENKDFIQHIQQMKKRMKENALESCHAHYYDKEGKTIVISVYENTNPAHEVLGQLLVWAEREGQDELINKIIEFSEIKTILN